MFSAHPHGADNQQTLQTGQLLANHHGLYVCIPPQSSYAKTLAPNETELQDEGFVEGIRFR